MANESLCLSCGFCCDGTLFARFFLDEAEAAWARRVHLPLIDDAEGARLLQPCAALASDGRCGHYAERPKPCRVFVCKLNTAVERGEVDLDAARQHVGRVRDLVSRVRAPIGQVRETTGDDPDRRLDDFELGRLVKRWFTMD